MQDKIEIYGKASVIQHGKLNDRVYLIKVVEEDLPDIIEYSNNLARENGYSKIFCKVPAWASPLFLANGFLTEAFIPFFFNVKDAVFFMSKFVDSNRLMNFENEKLNELSKLLLVHKSNSSLIKTEESFSMKKLTVDHAQEMADVYSRVFPSYPFPINKPEYIIKTMKENVQYFGMFNNQKIVALSSAEIDKNGGNAEMTDFATLPEFRGKKLSLILLQKMEEEMKKQAIYTLYTIARLNSLPMNKTFLNLNYKYSGTLINNTNISGKIESMNVLYKHLLKI